MAAPWPCHPARTRRATPPRQFCTRSCAITTRRSWPRRRSFATGKACHGSSTRSPPRSCGVAGLRLLDAQGHLARQVGLAVQEVRECRARDAQHRGGGRHGQAVALDEFHSDNSADVRRLQHGHSGGPLAASRAFFPDCPAFVFSRASRSYWPPIMWKTSGPPPGPCQD